MFVPILNQPLDDFNSFPSRNTCLFSCRSKTKRHVLRQIASDQDLQHSDQDLQHSDQDLQHSDQDLQHSDQDLQHSYQDLQFGDQEEASNKLLEV